MADDVKFRVGADTKPAKDELKKIDQEVKKKEINIEIDVDTKKVKKEIDELGREIEKKVPKVEIEVVADTEQAEKSMKEITEEKRTAKYMIEFENMEIIEKTLEDIKLKASMLKLAPQKASIEEFQNLQKLLDGMMEKIGTIQFNKGEVKHFREQGEALKKELETIAIKLDLDKSEIEAHTENLKVDFETLKKQAQEIGLDPNKFNINNFNKLNTDLDDLSEKASNFEINKEAGAKIKAEIENIKKSIQNVPMEIDLKREKELENKLEKIKLKIAQIKLDPDAFSKKQVENLKKELIEIAAKAEALHIGDPQKAKAMTDQIKEMSKSLASSQKEAGGLDKQFTMIKLTVAHLAADMVKKVLSSLKDMVKEGAKLNKELEHSIAKISTISSENTGVMNYKILEIGKNFGIDPRAISDGLYQVITSVGDVAGKFELVETSAKLAKTGFLEVNEAVDGLSTVINGYNLSMDKAADVANVFVKVQKLGKTTVREFADTLSRTIPIAKEVGMSFEEIGASIALITSKGAKTSEAQTRLASFLYEVQDAGSKINEVFQQAAGKSSTEFFNSGGTFGEYLKMLKDYGDKMNIDITSQLGNKNSKNFFLALTGDMDAYNVKLNEIKNNTGELETNLNTMMDTMQSRSERAKAYWDSLKDSIGGAVNGIVGGIGDMVTGYDSTTAAQARLNAEANKNINTIVELTKKMEGQYDMSKLTKEEQDELNRSLNSMKSMSSDLYNAYMSWTNGASSYANMLGVATQKQREFLALNAMIGLGENRKQLAEIQNEKVKNTVKGLDLVGGQAYAKGYNSLEQVFRDPELMEQIKRDPQKLEKFENLRGAEHGLNIKETSKKNEIETGQKELQQKDAEVTTGAALDLSKKIFELGNTISGNTEAVKENTNDNDTKTVRNEKEIELDFNKQIQELRKGMEGANEKTQKEITKGVRALELNKQKALKENELNKLDNDNRETKNKTALKEYNLKREILQTEILGLQNDLMLNEQGTSGGGSKKSKKDNSEKEAIKAFRENEQEINNDYLSRHNQLTEQYNNDMNAAIAENNQKAIEKLKEEYEKAIKNLDTEKKIELNTFKAENSPNITKAEKESLELQNQQLKLEQAQLESEEKNKALQKQMNDNLQNLNVTMENLGALMTNLANSNTGTGAGNTLNQALGIGGSILNGLNQVGALKGLLSGGGTLSSLLGGASKLFGNINKGAGVGNIISGIMGGGQQGNLGSTLGSVAGGLFGGGIGSVLGGALGSVVGSLFGSKKRKKQEKELKRYKKAQEALEKAQKYAASDWSIYAEDYAEQLQRRGAADYISMYDKLLNVRSLSQVIGTLEGNQLKGSSKFTSDGSAYGIKMDSLRDLMPQYTDKEIMDWFASITGGAVLNGEYLETGQGKYGVFDLEKLAEEISKINTEFAAELKQQIKEIINFTAENIASVVADGFGEGLEDLGDNLEKQIADSLKSAFLNTQVFKDLSNGFSDLMSGYITDLFKNDPNLGINMTADGLSSPQQYNDALKQYAEYATELQKEIFDELGLNINNLTGSIDSLNSNLSANTVQGLATNLFKYNAGQDPGQEFQQDIVINIMIDEDAMKKQIIKYTTDSLSKQRRGGYS